MEQRIGRVDRIDGRPQVQVSNFFYAGTVKEGIYRRIRHKPRLFSNVIGKATPLLAAAHPNRTDLGDKGLIDPPLESVKNTSNTKIHSPLDQALYSPARP